MQIVPRRSALYMPGSNARAMEKAKTLAADVLILDLEDSVAPDVKVEARDRVAGVVRAGGYGPREVVVRVNALDTPWGTDDMHVFAEAGPHGILLPKVRGAADIRDAASLLSLAPKHTRLWLMIETPKVILNLHEIAAAAPDLSNRLAVLVMGTNDLVKETRAIMDPGRTAALYWLSAAVTAARAGGLDIIDGVYNDLKDAAGFRSECSHGRMLGFDGKTLIHPDQIAPANEIFAPSEADVAAARKLVAVFDLPENRDRGAISLDGRMVERLHADIARRTVAVADAIAARGAQ
jgi:citrate lyase subunit beta/citryl-CoA lyase